MKTIDQQLSEMVSKLASRGESADLFADKAAAWTRWKTAGVPLKIGPKAALHNAMTRTAQQGKRLSQQAAETALMQRTERPPTVKTAYAEPPQVKMSELEKHTQCVNCKQVKEKCACGAKMASTKEKLARIFGSSPESWVTSGRNIPMEDRQEGLKEHFQRKSQEQPSGVLSSALGGGAVGAGLGGLAALSMKKPGLPAPVKAGLLLGGGLGAGTGLLLRASDKHDIMKAKETLEKGDPAVRRAMLSALAHREATEEANRERRHWELRDSIEKRAMKQEHSDAGPPTLGSVTPKQKFVAEKQAQIKEALNMGSFKAMGSKIMGKARQAGSAVSQKAGPMAGKVGDKIVSMSPAQMAAISGGVGAVGGAAAAGEGNRLKGAIGGAALGAGAGVGGKKLLENRAWNKAIGGAKARVAADEARAASAKATQHAAAREAAKSGIKVPMSEMAPEDALRYGTKLAFMRAVNPTSAASSVDALKGELVAKTASMSDKAKKVLEFIKRNPSARDAAIWGSAGATMGALHDPMPGRSRLGNALRGGLTGAAGGAVAGEVARRLSKTAAYSELDPKEIKADKLPERGLPATPLDKDVEAVKNKLLGAVDDIRELKADITAGPKIPKVRLRRPPQELMEGLRIKEASMKSTLEFLKDPATLAAMGIGGLAGGGGVYLANRPKKSLGGKGAAEADLEAMVEAQKLRGEEGMSFPRRLKNRYVEFSKGLATDFRKNPGQAAAMGALTGATAGALAAKMLGAGR